MHSRKVRVSGSEPTPPTSMPASTPHFLPAYLSQLSVVLLIGSPPNWPREILQIQPVLSRTHHRFCISSYASHLGTCYIWPAILGRVGITAAPLEFVSYGATRRSRKLCPRHHSEVNCAWNTSLYFFVG